MTIPIRFPDPEYAEEFRAYTNYFEDLAGVIGGHYGWRESLVEGVLAAVSSHLRGVGIASRRLTPAEERALDSTLRKAWSNLRRLHREVEDSAIFDEEANAWIPVQAYYAVYHSILAYSIAAGRTPPRDHSAALNSVARDVRRGLWPFPWSVYCEGCPQTGSHTFGGVGDVDVVHVLSAIDPETSEDRLAMFLRTTRQKELDRRFATERRRSPRPGMTRRNLSRVDKERMAGNLRPTTVFELIWRVRKKAHYDEADAFVLGAADETDARRLGESLVIVTDATVAAMEAVIAAYVGDDILATSAEAYESRSGSGPSSPVGRRASAWRKKAGVLVPF